MTIKIKSSESCSKQPTQLIVDLNSSLRHIIVTKKYSGIPCRGLLWLIIMCLHDSSKLYSARQNCAVRNIYNRRAKHQMKNMLKTFNIINFAAFFRVDLLLCIEVEKEKVGLENEKALKLFSIGVQWKTSKAGQRNNLLIFILISLQKHFPNMQQNILLHSGMITPNILLLNSIFWCLKTISIFSYMTVHTKKMGKCMPAIFYNKHFWSEYCGKKSY